MILLSSCTTTPKEIVITKNVPIFIKPPYPVGTTLEVPKFYVVTDSSCQKVYSEVGPLFSLDTVGYQQMARNIQELRRYILELQNVIKYYEKAIEINNESN